MSEICVAKGKGLHLGTVQVDLKRLVGRWVVVKVPLFPRITLRHTTIVLQYYYENHLVSPSPKGHDADSQTCRNKMENRAKVQINLRTTDTGPQHWIGVCGEREISHSSARLIDDDDNDI